MLSPNPHVYDVPCVCVHALHVCGHMCMCVHLCTVCKDIRKSEVDGGNCPRLLSTFLDEVGSLKPRACLDD